MSDACFHGLSSDFTGDVAGVRRVRPYQNIASPLDSWSVRWFVSDSAEPEARRVQSAIVHGSEFIESAGRVYPTWLNITAAIVLPLVPLGLILLLLGAKTWGLSLMGVGFLSIWIFGELAARLGQVNYRKKRVESIS